MPPALITPMLISAAVGAVSAAVQGGNILKGALFGALGGAVGGMISGAVGGAAGSAGGALAEGAASAATAAAPFEAGFVGTEALTGGMADVGGAMGGMNNPSAFVSPGGGMMAGEAAAAGAPAGTGLAEVTGSTGIGGSAPGASTGLGGTQPGNTGMGGPVGNTGLSSQPTTSGGSFVDDLLNKGKGMMNSKTMLDVGGRVLSGYAQGRQQQSMLDARAKEIADARANARFGNVGSRYNQAGMMTQPNYGKG